MTAQRSTKTTFAGLARVFGLPSLEELRPTRRVEGIAVFPYPVKLQGTEIVTEFVWQIGPRTPVGRDMLLINENGGKGFYPVGWIPKEAVKAVDIRVGDEVSAISLGKTRQKLDPDSDPVELLEVSAELALASTNAFTRGMLPQNWQLLVNGEPPAERLDWRMGVDPRDVYYPRVPWDLGNDSVDEASQMVQLAGRIGRGVKLLIFGPAGSAKTMTTFAVLEGMVKHNTGRPVFIVIGLFGERAEDIGEAMRRFEQVIYTPDGGLVGNVAGIRTFFCDADFETLPFEMLRIAQACIGFAQRQIERCARLPVAERYSVVVLLDSASRIFAAMDFAQQGKGMTRSGGRDPYSEIMVNLLHHVGRSVMVPDPVTGQPDLIDVTAMFTLLGDTTRLSIERMESQAATITYMLPLLDPEQRPAEARRWPTIYWPALLVRQPQLLVEDWELEARRRLRGQLYEQDRRKGTAQLKADAVMTVEQLLDKHGSATVALKSLVPDLLLGPETEKARELVQVGAFPGDDLTALDQLVLMLVIPKDWGPKIWKQLADEGLVEPLDFLEARKLAIEGRLETPKDLHGLPGVDSFRATGLWDRFATEGLVPPLEQLFQRALRKEEIRSADDLVTALGITRTRAQELWGVLWVDAPEPKVAVAEARPDNGLLIRTRELIGDGKVFTSAEALALALGTRFDDAEAVLDLLTIGDYTAMAITARPDLHRITQEKGCGLIDAVKLHFDVPFGFAKDVVEGLKKPAKQGE